MSAIPLAGQPPEIEARSPSGAPTCPSAGPLSAKILLVGESPAAIEIRDQTPFVGPAGRILNLCLGAARIPRDTLRVVNLVPARAPNDDFAAHTPVDRAWGLALLEREIRALPDLRVIVALGNHPMEAILGLHGITTWRGSLFPAQATLVGDPLNEYWTRLSRAPLVAVPPGVATIATFHPAAVARQFPWHYWLVHDLAQAAAHAAGTRAAPHAREWHIQAPADLERLVYDTILAHEHMVAIDTEMDPPIVSLVTEDEVHAFTWDASVDRLVRGPMTALLESPAVLKVAHNMAHDWRDIELRHGIRVARPWYDTIAGAHILEPSGFDPGGDRDKRAKSGQLVGKALSPHIATRYTSWPYHKWMVDVDPHVYCGLDSVVCYDAYWAQLDRLAAEPAKLALVEHDMRLFAVTSDMTRRGVLVDEVARAQVADELRAKVDALDARLNALVDPVIDDALDRGALNQPDLHQKTTVCKCCRAAKNKRERCWSCAGLDEAPSKAKLALMYRARVAPPRRPEGWPDRATKAQLEAIVLGPCERCADTPGGRVTHRLPFNWDSPAQVGDLFYRALGVRARSYQGAESTRVELLERLLDEGGALDDPRDARGKTAREILLAYVERTNANIDLETVTRLAPDESGRIRSIFDLWYTPTGRVASREGLHDPGTNLQNIPKEARRLIVPDPGHVFCYPDYAQIEGRCLAVACDERALKAIYSAGGDSHQAVADLVSAKTGVPITRDQAKRTTFASFYGIEADHLSTILGVTPLVARKILDAIFQTFPGARRYQQAVVDELRRSRSNTSPTGWQRRWLGYVLEERGRHKGHVKDKVKKEALASTPQNMAAHILGLGLVAIAEEAPWILPAVHVHDAGLLQVPVDRAQEAIEVIERNMTITKWDMTFPAEASFGPNWLVASLNDKDKVKRGYASWTRSAILERGIPAE